jgi:EF hand
MLTSAIKVGRRLTVAAGPGALMFRLVRLTGGSPSGSSSGMTSEKLYNEYDTNNDNQISQTEWDQAYQRMDTNGDGVVTQDGFNLAVGGFRGGGRR